MVCLHISSGKFWESFLGVLWNWPQRVEKNGAGKAAKLDCAQDVKQTLAGHSRWVFLNFKFYIKEIKMMYLYCL